MFLAPSADIINEDLGLLHGFRFKLFSLSYLREHPETAKCFRDVYTNVYHNTKWPEVFDKFLEEKSVNQLIFALYKDEKLISGRTLTFPCPQDDYFEKMCEPATSINCKNAMRGHQAFTVKEYQGKGIIKSLIRESNRIAYERFGADYALGISSHCYAYPLYEKLGARIFQNDIDTINMYLSPEENRRFYKKFTTDPELKNWKIEKAIRYSYNLKEIYD